MLPLLQSCDCSRFGGPLRSLATPIHSLCSRESSEILVVEPYDSTFLRKEVIQPQVPLRLPCYDLVPIRELVFGTCVLAVHSVTSDAPPFRGLTGGVYKAQEHIHRSIADLRLLAIPASCRRVAACNPNWAALFGICSTSRSCFPLYAAL